mmetsp:Transcript_19948/g.64948  ORF Transcript_19948/g.64948 Transcript_19948/m.64948 type:complete len:117 (+) Transcript_19948:2276-2626(+)
MWDLACVRVILHWVSRSHLSFFMSIEHSPRSYHEGDFDCFRRLFALRADPPLLLPLELELELPLELPLPDPPDDELPLSLSELLELSLSELSLSELLELLLSLSELSGFFFFELKI